ALSLLEGKDKSAIPALIALLKQRGDDADSAESALQSVAGEQAPPAPGDDTAASRAGYHKGWAKGWDDHKEKIDLAKLDLTASGRGYLLVATLSVTKGTVGSVMQLAPSGRERWKIENLRYPVWASITRYDRVLISEYYGNKISERDFK